MGDEKSLLSCRDISKYFGAMAAVDSLSFDVNEGEIFGISGPNGAGKTTLFEVISGLNPADKGVIIFDGEDLTRHRPQKICQLGLSRVFQSNAAFDSLTVSENIAVGAVYGVSSGPAVPLYFSQQTRDTVAQVMAQVGLEGKGDHVAANLSVLDRKRLMFGAALSSSPKLLLLDEPVGGLNPREMDHMAELVSTIAKSGTTVVLIEHVMRFMVQLADRVMIMHHGEEIFVGLPEALPKNTKVAEVYLGQDAAEQISKYLKNK